MASSQAAIQSSATPAFAGLVRRIAAYLIDLAIALGVLFLLGFTMRGLRAAGLWTPATIENALPEELWRALGIGSKLAVLLAFVLSMGPVYIVLFHASPWQATFGKRLLNIYVADDNGRRLSLARSFGRWVAFWVSSWFGGALVSVITIAVTRKKQALHDVAANTLVLKGAPVPEGRLEAWRVVAAFGIPFLWMMATFFATM